jgi:YD repeat-containing protein
MMQPGLRIRPGLIRIPQAATGLTVSILAVLGVLMPSETGVADTYSYDLVGRLTTASYDNGLCIAYGYDANGNRITQSNAFAPPVWGSGVWGCIRWTPQ